MFKKEKHNKIEAIEKLNNGENLSLDEMNEISLFMYEDSKKSINKHRTFVILFTPFFMFQIVAVDNIHVLLLCMCMLVFNGYQLGLCKMQDENNEKFLKEVTRYNEAIAKRSKLEKIEKEK